MEAPVGYYRHPTIAGDRIVFVAEDDLWSVPATGGTATRLTANPGTASVPCLSPDGVHIAYMSRDEGDLEVHVMPAHGGPSRRLTHLGALTTVLGWRGNDEVVVASDFEQPFARLMTPMVIPVDGSVAARLDVGPARAISFEAGGGSGRGRGVVIGRNSADPARWKRYRGGTAGTIWIDRAGSGEFERLVNVPGNTARPMWLGRRIYFLSDHEGHANIYSCTPTGRSLTRHTHHDDFYARWPHSDGDSIVYHAGADIWRFDVAAGTTERLSITLPSARPQRNRRFEPADRFVESVDVHPAGEGLAITARGTVFTGPSWEAAPVAHGRSSDVRLRLGTWLPDGERFVAVSDESGEERLVVMAADGTQDPRALGAEVGRPFWIEAAPAGADRVAVLNERQELVLVNVRSGRGKVIHHSPWARIHGMAWSPDGRWLAFGASVSLRTGAMHLADTTTGRVHQVTAGDFMDGWPSFDPAGEYLYFLSWRTFNPVSDALFHDHGFPQAAKPYAVPLSSDTASPFAVEQRPARPPGGSPNGPDTKNKSETKNKIDAKNNDAKSKANAGDGEEPQPVKVDLDGFEQRMCALPLPEGRYSRVLGLAGRIAVLSFPVEGGLGRPRTQPPRPKGRIQAYDFNRNRVDTVMDGVSSMSASMDGKTLAIRAGRKVRLVPTAFKDESQGSSDETSRETGWIPMARYRVEIDPGAEWAQMLREAWRLQRDQFWTEDMSGVDWQAVLDRYEALVERVTTRSEFSDLMWEMQGELGTSHAYEMGGDYRPSPRWHRGFLGVDARWDRRADAWRIERIIQGDSWDPAATSPLTAPGLDVQPGDRLVSIDGKNLDAETTPGEALADRAGRAVTVRLARGRRRPHSVVAKALRTESPLRYRDWVEANRAAVHDATDGAVGYVHIPNMGVAGFAEFHRYYPVEVQHDGLIVDVRFNGGGNVSQILLERLLRRRVGYSLARHSGLRPYPFDSPAGPMVAITNEWAGSDGDIFSHAFKLYGLGPLIGTRTWGGVVGIWPRHSLVDGTVTTQPEFSTWFEDVGWGVEGYGTDPDIEVDITPQDYRAGRDPQMERAIAEVMGRIDAHTGAPPDLGPGPVRTPPTLK